MGVADRDYMREAPPSSGSGAKLLVVVLALLIALGGAFRLAHVQRPNGIVVRPFVAPHSPGFTVATPAVPQSPYSANDPWRAWLAPDSVCPGGDDYSASLAVQRVTALCLLNFARWRENLPPLRESPVLDAGAARKAEDIIACRDFSHYACGKQPYDDARAAGLTDPAFGENIYWGPELYRTPRVAVDQWLNSPEHRDNLFSDRWVYQGVAVASAPGFKDGANGEIWVDEFSAP